MELLNNKVIVVTGGCGLLGFEFVKAIAHHGGIPVIADINAELGEQKKKELLRLYPHSQAFNIQLDITNRDSIQALIETLHRQWGRIDALVNNAYPRNKNYGRKLEEVTYDDFCENVNLNLGGYFLTSQQFCNYFVEQGYGNIVNISSIYGVVAPRFEVYDSTPMTMPVEYAAIKSALIHLTKYMAKYFKGKNIRVNSISLGGLLDRQPVSFVRAYESYCLNKGMLAPDDVAGALLFLLSDQSQFVNGHNLLVDDGFSL